MTNTERQLKPLTTQNRFINILKAFFWTLLAQSDLHCQQSNVCCLDYSVAKEGVLAAY
jgi:hypothetical protein